MGITYASSVLIKIVSDNPGLSKEEIFRINDEIYRANFRTYFNFLDPSNRKSPFFVRDVIMFRDGKYYPKDDIDEFIKRAERIIERFRR